MSENAFEAGVQGGQDDELDAYTQLEAEAAGLLDQHGDDLDGRASALIRHFRKLAKGHRAALERVASETREQVLAEQTAARRAEAGFRRLGVPEGARALFQGVDPGDGQAMAARAAELRAMGVTWGQPQAPPPPAVDPTLAAQAAMQAAEAGGNAPDPLEARVARMAASPDAASAEQVRGITDEVNARVRAASSGYSSGAVG